MFSLIQTAIENGLDPYKYLTWLMKTANGADLSQKDMIHTLLPWKAPTECKAKQKNSTSPENSLGAGAFSVWVADSLFHERTRIGFTFTE